MAGGEEEGKDKRASGGLLTDVMWRDPKAIKRWLEAGADINATWQNGKTAIHDVVTSQSWRDDSEILKILLDAGADVNVRDRDGITALHLAAGSKQKKWVAELLIGRRANVNCEDMWGATPLDHAVIHQNMDVAMTLLKHGGKATFRGKDYDVLSPAEQAALRERNAAVIDRVRSDVDEMNGADGNFTDREEERRGKDDGRTKP